ncbi:MAG: rhomboid family intramembrane serine protease [Chloroflexi bacterium]|nr:rhomboid family intramembrane serine protease [Chloroflexota bacterium]
MCLIISFILLVLSVIISMSFIYPLPINDARTTRYRSLPWSTYLLISINAIVFLAWLGPDLYGSGDEPPNWPSYVNKISSYGYREDLITSLSGTETMGGIGALATFSSMFMHADIWHLFSNMIFLWTFGRRIEDACGHSRFLVFYIFAGMVANVGSVMLNPADRDIPGIGASGAIFGVMGAYLLLFPNGKIISLWGLGAIFRIPFAAVRMVGDSDVKLWRWAMPLPAWFLLLVYVAINIGPSLETIFWGDNTGGVDTLAHLTGFAAALTIFFFVRKDLLVRFLSGRTV